MLNEVKKNEVGGKARSLAVRCGLCYLYCMHVTDDDLYCSWARIVPSLRFRRTGYLAHFLHRNAQAAFIKLHPRSVWAIVGTSSTAAPIWVAGGGASARHH